MVSKEEVKGIVRVMMTTAKGEQLRKNVLKLKEYATKAVVPGGSSFNNLSAFVKEMGEKSSSPIAESNQVTNKNIGVV